MYFCIRDDDTSFFTAPEDLERVYGEVSRRGPVSLAVVPFHRAGTSKGVPERFRNQWSVHPLHENPRLVSYLRDGVVAGRFEIMLHGYYHDERHGQPEFDGGDDLTRRVVHGRAYLEELLGTTIRVFVPPRNGIGREGLRAIARGWLAAWRNRRSPTRLVAAFTQDVVLVVSTAPLAQGRWTWRAVDSRSWRSSRDCRQRHHTCQSREPQRSRIRKCAGHWRRLLCRHALLGAWCSERAHWRAARRRAVAPSCRTRLFRLTSPMAYGRGRAVECVCGSAEASPLTGQPVTHRWEKRQ